MRKEGFSLENRKLAATMFGGFSMTLDGEPLLLWQNRGSRVTGLLQYLLFHQKKSFRKEELYDILFEDLKT